MKLRSAVPATLAMLFSLAALASAQTITPPPMKMGLWQAEVTMQMSGMPNGANIPSRTVVSQTCMTPDTWKDSLTRMQNRQRTGPSNCSVTNVQQDGHHFTADVQCTSQQFTSNGHIDMQFDSDESMHGTTTVSMGGPNAPSGMQMQMVVSSKSKFLSSDCGDVKPGQPKMIQGGPGGGPPS
jgi:Protein of unknown function (DUF3617)